MLINELNTIYERNYKFIKFKEDFLRNSNLLNLNRREAEIFWVLFEKNINENSSNLSYLDVFEILKENDRGNISEAHVR
ncbi:MAG: hypothetical protein ACTSVE_01990, partial [Candidatus Helarchaeota archaeon]